MKKPRKILALDLGSTAFKMALLEVGDSGQKIRWTHRMDLPFSGDSKARVEALRALLAQAGVSDPVEVISVVDDPFACLRTVMTPPMPPAELANAIRWQLQPLLAIPLEEAAVEYEPAEAAPGDDPKKRKFLVASYPAVSIREHLNLLTEAGLRPTQLIPKETAVGAWLLRRNLSSGGSGAVLEVGGSGCEFMVIEKGHPVFTRKIADGGAALTHAMTGGLMTPQGQVSLAESEAETFKRSIGIPNPSETSTAAVGKISGAQVFSLIRGNLERLATEVERSLAFYGESDSPVKISELLLIGGEAHLKGLAPWFQDRLGIQVVLPDVEAAGSDVPLSLVPVLGAALNQGRGMNFLPEEFRAGVRRQVERAALKAMVTAFLLGALLLRVGLEVSRQSLHKQVAALRLEQQAVDSQMSRIHPSLAAQERVASEPGWQGSLRVLSRVLPPEIHLTEFRTEGRSVSIRGRVERGSRRSEEVLGAFMQTLGQQWMSRVTLRSSRLIEPSSGLLDFEISGELR